MATLAELNVRIGADIKQLNAGIRQAKRTLRTTARDFDNLGRSMSLSITAPLGLIGGFAVKAQADFDQLRKGIEVAMTSSGRSIEDAREEIEKLRAESVKPGLTFDNLLKGSIKLQSVGFSAEEARRSLTVFGNALALAGGNAQDLDGVNLALTQIVSKGQVFAEEINQIAERVPQVRKAMLSAFGTARTEDIQKMNLAAEDFIRIITEELAKLPDAPESLSNAFKNARQSITFALQDIGGALEETFDISGNVGRFSSFLSDAIKGFRELAPSVQKFTIGATVALAAFGPLTTAIGKSIALIANAKIFYANYQKILLETSGSVSKLTAAFRALSVAQKATLIGISVVAVTALAAAYVNLSGGITGAEKAQTRINKARNEAISQTQAELVKVRALISAINDENTSRDAKSRAINQLKQISPDYFGQLREEDGIVKGLETSYENYAKALTKATEVKILTQQLEDLVKQQKEVEQAFSGNILDKVGALGIGGALKSALPGGVTSALGSEFADLQVQINALEKELANKLKNQLEDTGETGAESTKDITEGTKKAKDEVLTFEQELARLQKRLTEIPKRSEEYISTLQQIEEIQKRIAFIDRPAVDVPQTLSQEPTVLPVTFLANEDSAASLATQIKEIGDKVFSSTKGLDITPFTNLSKELDLAKLKFEALQDPQQYMTDQISAMGAAIQLAIETGWDPQKGALEGLIEQYKQLQSEMDKTKAKTEANVEIQQAFKNAASAAGAETVKSFADIGRAALKAAAQVVKAKLIEAVAIYIADAFQEFGIYGAIFAAAAGSIVGGVFDSAIGAITAPALADGGVITGPTLALVGEYPGASTNPEIVTPENKLRKIFNESGGMSGGHITVDDIYLDGDMIRIALKESERKSTRVYGG